MTDELSRVSSREEGTCDQGWHGAAVGCERTGFIIKFLALLPVVSAWQVFSRALLGLMNTLP